MEQRDPKKTIHIMYFKSVLIFYARTQTSEKEQKQNPMDMKFLRDTAGETRREKKLEMFHPLTHTHKTEMMLQKGSGH